MQIQTVKNNTEYIEALEKKTSKKIGKNGKRTKRGKIKTDGYPDNLVEKKNEKCKLKEVKL